MFRRTIFVTVLLALVVSGCKKLEKRTPTTTTVTNTTPDLPSGVSMMVNNEDWTATSYTARYKAYSSSPNADTVFELDAFNATGTHMHFHLFDLKMEEFNFPATNKGPVFFFLPDTTSASRFTGTRTYLRITKLTGNNVQGHFHASMYLGTDSLVFTNGTFNVPYKRE